jgi:ATP-dependent protease ClpP protease subunit
MKKINGNIDTINILLNSAGGDVIETLALIDYMKSQKDEIKFNIIVRGMAMSAAALLLSNGTGIRAASKHSKIMVHQLSTIVVGKLSDVKSNAKFSEELELECNELMAKSTKMDKEYWQNIQSSDYFMNAEKICLAYPIDAYKEERSATIKMGSAFVYPQQIMSSNIIDAMLFWYKFNKPSSKIFYCGIENLFHYAKYVKEESIFRFCDE